jgi:parallel beta-helix repeat protein
VKIVNIILILSVFIILSASLLSFGCDETTTPIGDGDVYVLSDFETDINRPPSGTAGAWITIRGGDSGGAPGNVYYVALDGDDANAGTMESPWASPAYGAGRLAPGDTLVILGGDKGEVPILAGTDDLYSAFDLSGCSYVRVENIEITSYEGDDFRDGISMVDAPCEHIVLEDLYIHHIDEFAIDAADVNHLEITNCRITHCGYGCIGGPTGSAGGWRNVVVHDCELSYSGHYYQGGPGPSPYDRPDGFGIEASNGPIEIKNTVARHNRGDGLDSKANNTYIHECVVSNNTCDGIKLWGTGSKIENCLVYGTGDGEGGGSPWAGIVIETETQPGATFTVVNVTVHDNPSREAYPMYVQYGIDVPINLTMRNTIIANGSGPVYFGDSVNLTAEYNLFYRPGGGEQVYADGRGYGPGELGQLGPGNIFGDPKFVAPAWGEEGDYHLRDGSPAINAGTATGAPAIDLDGVTRPQGAGYDMGAYEKG